MSESPSDAPMPFTPPLFAENLRTILTKVGGPEANRERVLTAIDNVFLAAHLELLAQGVAEDHEARVLELVTHWLDDATETIRRDGLGGIR